MSKPISFSNFIADLGIHDELLHSLLSGMCLAAVEISCKLSACISAHMHHGNGKLNAQGEWQQHMDVFAEECFFRQLEVSKGCCLVVSEEQPNPVRFRLKNGESTPPYIVALDPLDGSSNVAENVPVGSIFSIYKRIFNDEPIIDEEALRNGDEQLAAGYFLYGTSTMLVFACGTEVNGFTLDPASNEFMLSHPCMRVPLDGTVYAVNDANYPNFSKGPQNFLRYCRQQAELGDRAFTARYSGSMVSDIHRILVCGGIFLYPGTFNLPKGKLRLAYECFPIAYIMEKAGGLATTGSRRLLDVALMSIHQRSPIVTGSANLVMIAEKFLNTTLPPLYELDRQIG